MTNFIVINILTFLIPLGLSGQSLKEAKTALKKIDNPGQIEDLKKQYPDWKIYDDKTLLSDSSKFPEIINGKVGDVLLKQHNPNAPTFVIKILAERDEELCKLKYIYLDGNKLSSSLIDSLRALITDKYNSGEDFVTLVKTYSMDGNPTGDLGWFYKGMMVDEFDSAVRNRKKDEIFNVDVRKNGWYYVVLKTHDNKFEKAQISVKIRYSN